VVIFAIWIGGYGTGLATALFAFAGEVIDTKDLDALSKTVEVLARKR
jgi:hypothetical protein